MFLMLMRKLRCNLLFIFLLLVLSAYSSGIKDEKKNVEITLFLDKDMTEVGQNVFVWSFIFHIRERTADMGLCVCGSSFGFGYFTGLYSCG